MDTTQNTFKALQAQRKRNAALSGDELEEARKEGAKALIEAVKRGEPFFLMDEYSSNDLQNAYATGWNTGG